MKSQKAVKHLPCCWRSTSSNLAFIDGGDLVEDPVAGLFSLLDLKFIDKLDRKKELMIEYLLLFIAQYHEIILRPEMQVICNINTGTTLKLKTIINELECNKSVNIRINCKKNS